MLKSQPKLDLTSITNAVIAAAVITILYIRIYFGIDYTDESQYVGQAMMLINGGKAFVNDLFYQQTSSWVIYPFVKAFVSFQGNSDGVFLLVRHIFFFFSLLCSGIAFLSLRNVISKSFHLLTLSNFVFIPFSVPSISYNTIAFNLLFVVIAILISGLENIESSIKFAISALILTAASFFYPSLTVILFLYLSFLFWFLQRRAFFQCLATVAITGMMFLATIALFNQNPLDLAASLRFTGLHGSFRPLKEVFFNLYHFLFPTPWIGISLFATLLLRNYSIHSFLFLLIFIFSFTFSVKLNPGWPFNNFFILIISANLLWSILIYGFKELKVLALASFILISSLLISFTSSNGILSGSFGLTSLLIVFSFVMTKFTNRTGLVLNPATSALVCLVLLWGSFSFFYREQEFSSLTQKVTTSPFKGLYTSPQKAEFIINLDRELKSLPVHSKIFSFYFFPAAYTWYGLFPQTNSLFNFYSCLNDTSELRMYSEYQLKGLDEVDYLLYTPRLAFTEEESIHCATTFSVSALDKNFVMQKDLNFLKLYKRK